MPGTFLEAFICPATLIGLQYSRINLVYNWPDDYKGVTKYCI